MRDAGALVCLAHMHARTSERSYIFYVIELNPQMVSALYSGSVVECSL